MTSSVIYNGQLRTTAIHLQSSNSILTDAPTDNHGKGEAFSPTDLLATSLASCMLTVMGIKASQMDVDIDGATASVKKIMNEAPRRVAAIEIHITFPQRLDEKTYEILTRTGRTCPVAFSLHSELKQIVEFSNGQ